ncbi:MAG: hypothetical protein ACLR7Z_21555 [Bilophila wadsworthia]
MRGRPSNCGSPVAICVLVSGGCARSRGNSSPCLSSWASSALALVLNRLGASDALRREPHEPAPRAVCYPASPGT